MLPESWGPMSSRRGFSFVKELENDDVVRIFPFHSEFDENFIITVSNNKVKIFDKTGQAEKVNLVQNPTFSKGSENWLTRNIVDFGGGLAFLQPDDFNAASIRQSIPTINGDTYEIRVFCTGIFPVRLIGGTADGANNLFDITLTDVGPLIHTFTAGGFGTWIEIASLMKSDGGANVLVDSVHIKNLSDPADPYEFVSPWNLDDVPKLHFDMEPNNDSMYIVGGNVTPHRLTRVNGAPPPNAWVFEPVPFTDEPWGNLDYPQTIAFHRGRLFLASNIIKPAGIWSSRSGDFIDFTEQTPGSATPGDPLDLPLDKHGTIKWMRSNKKLFVGMDTGEHVIFGWSGPLDVDNAQTEQHSTYGSSGIQGLVINEQLAYVDASGRILRSLDYNERSETWISNRISFASEHITEGIISHMSYGVSPQSILWMTTFDGDLVTCSVERDVGTIGWARHDTQGDFMDVAVLKERGVDVPWVLVRRNAKIYLERYNWSYRTFLDSVDSKYSDTPTTTFPGFDHLDFTTVSVMVDGAVHPDVYVEDGIIELNYEAKYVTAGYRFNRLIKTHPKIDERQTGNTFEHFKRWVSLVIAVIGSVRPKVNGEDTFRRHPATPMDLREFVRTEYIYTTQLGHTPEGSVTIEDDTPLDFMITGIGGNLSEDTL